MIVVDLYGTLGTSINKLPLLPVGIANPLAAKLAEAAGLGTTMNDMTVVALPHHRRFGVNAVEYLGDNLDDSLLAGGEVVALLLGSGTGRWQHFLQYSVGVLDSLLELSEYGLATAGGLGSLHGLWSLSRRKAYLRHQLMVALLDITQLPRLGSLSLDGFFTFESLQLILQLGHAPHQTGRLLYLRIGLGLLDSHAGGTRQRFTTLSAERTEIAHPTVGTLYAVGRHATLRTVHIVRRHRCTTECTVVNNFPATDGTQFHVGTDSRTTLGAHTIGLSDLRGGIRYGGIRWGGLCPYLLALTHSYIIFCHIFKKGIIINIQNENK